MKDTIFSFSRLIHLLHKDVVENRKKYFLYIGTMFGIFVVFFLWKGFFVYKSSPHDLSDNMVSICANMFLIMWLGCGGISVTFTMENLKHKSGRISFFTLPAAPLEKYFSRWLMTTVIFLFFLVLSFKLADYIRVLVFSLGYPSLPITSVSLSSIFAVSGQSFHIYSDMTSVYTTIIVYFFMHSCFLLGSVFWPKNAFPRTFLALFLILVVFVTAMWGAIQLFRPEGVVGGTNISIGSSDGLGIGRNIYWTLGIVLTLFNWIIGYYRFKETDIL